MLDLQQQLEHLVAFFHVDVGQQVHRRALRDRPELDAVVTEGPWEPAAQHAFEFLQEVGQITAADPQVAAFAGHIDGAGVGLAGAGHHLEVAFALLRPQQLLDGVVERRQAVFDTARGVELAEAVVEEQRCC